MKPIRLLLIDDHAVLREGLSFMLTHAGGMEVIAETGDPEEGVRLWSKHRPQVTLLDLFFPNGSGLEVLSEIRGLSPEARILVLTSAEGDENIHQAKKLGASGYLLKSARAREITEAVRSVAAGNAHWPEEVSRRLAERKDFEPLSAREMEVLEMLAKGLSNKELSSALGISEFTCKVHVRHILAKLRVADRTEAVILAHQRGLVRIV